VIQIANDKTKMSIVIIFIFAFTATYCPYLGAISCQQKYLTLIFFCLFAGWGEHHGKQGWLHAEEDMCGHVSRLVHKTGFKLQQQQHVHIHEL
jgi:hypothetical protein